MWIKVKTFTNREIEIDVEPGDRIERIKSVIEEREGIPPVQQRVDHKIVSECKISAGSVLHMVLSLRGG